ncbi:hypothetical protein TTHERM_00992780 (macronuclear) [Tetrahymena thermophila SB210]|uniref:Uncharacterized protein n=1 Tax=Tetrahymena thermophila (strain SB210) TaxID=312017 RepID=Q22DC4_TETTS|nr:hypothetical protein TTHERM_00992780 [Tetrahymena thermophila SB210]EAR83278.4 hypothetical protein TTHERM_00992780 [Tetrahymena thermophila SB210]|eukprot:XP_001030941.4 hypothetical protein TTHERM_00992780 [Tetrahymena thermophila SB210]
MQSTLCIAWAVCLQKRTSLAQQKRYKANNYQNKQKITKPKERGKLNFFISFLFPVYPTYTQQNQTKMVKKALSQKNMVQTCSRITRSQSQIFNLEEASRQSNKKISSQNYLEDYEESLSQALSENFENFDQTSIQASNGGYSDQDDYLFSDNESTASFRYCNKSISKSSKSSKQAKSGKLRSSRSLRTATEFLEDKEESNEVSTYDYNILRFQNLKRKKTFRIYCFNEQDLKIPQKFQESIVQNESDDDKESDNEQVNNAINHVHKSLLEAIEEENAY